MYVVTYADAKNHISRKSGFLTVKAAERWITENNITPFKLLFDRGDGCPETVRNYNNFASGKFAAEYLFKSAAI